MSRAPRVTGSRAKSCWGIVCLITLGGATLRFATLHLQSFGLDETFTVWLSRKDFGAMLSDMSRTEGTPPLYYVVAWIWARVFESSEVGLRSLSALAGTAAIPLAAWLANRFSGARAAVATAALVAVNPLLVWYSQEARAYALLVVLTTISIVLLVRAIATPSRGRLALWAGSAALVISTHYFGAFMVAGESLLLVLRTPKRAALTACMLPLCAALALLPLLLAQKASAVTELHGSPVYETGIVVKQLLTGPSVPGDHVIAAIALACVLVALLAFTDPRRRAAALLPAILAAGAVVPPALLAYVGTDYLSTRYLVAGVVPAAVALSIGFVASRRTVAAGAVLVAMSLLAVVLMMTHDRYQRIDYRDAARAIGPPERSRAVVYTPKAHFEVYLPGAHELPSAGARVSAIDVIALTYTDRGDTTPPRAATERPPAGFRFVSRDEAATFTHVRYGSTSERRVRPAVLRELDLAADDFPTVLVQAP